MLLCDQGCVWLHQNPFSSSVVVLSCFQRASEDRHIQYCVGWTPGRQTLTSEEGSFPFRAHSPALNKKSPGTQPFPHQPSPVSVLVSLASLASTCWCRALWFGFSLVMKLKHFKYAWAISCFSFLALYLIPTGLSAVYLSDMCYNCLLLLAFWFYWCHFMIS